MRIEPYNRELMEKLAIRIFKNHKDLLDNPNGEKRTIQVEANLSVWTVEEDGQERYALDQLIVHGEGSISIGSLNVDSPHGRVIFSKKGDCRQFTVEELEVVIEALIDERPLDDLKVSVYSDIYIRAACTGKQATGEELFTGRATDRTHFARLIRHWVAKQGGTT